MTRNTIIPYPPLLRERSRQLRRNSTLGEVLLWKGIKGRTLGWQFHRQVPMDAFIVDFYCHELFLAIEIDGGSHDNKQDYDRDRQAKLESFGIRFIRFSETDVRMNMNGVLNTLQRKIDECAEGRRPMKTERFRKRNADSAQTTPPLPVCKPGTPLPARKPATPCPSRGGMDNA